MESSDGMDEEQLEDLYNWVDEIPLSRPKKSIARDFADGGWFFRSLFDRSRSGVYINLINKTQCLLFKACAIYCFTLREYK